MTVNKAVLLAVGAIAMFMAGALMTDDVHRRASNAIAEDKNALRAVLAECDYSPHPISDVSWELYRQGFIPLGTAGYYTHTVKSVNGPAAKCLRLILSEWWAIPGGP